jgi:hypothetical protein
MNARRQAGGFFHRLIDFFRRLREAIRHVRGRQAAGGRSQGGRGRQQMQCPACHRFVRAICQDAEEGAEPCRLGLDCGCCPGEHRAAKGAQDGGKFQTSVERA